MRFIEALWAQRDTGRAFLAANFYNAETLLAILRAARERSAAIILQTSPSTLEYLGLQLAAAMARTAAQENGVTAWLHLDHASDPTLIRRCLEAGYDSVMIDASDRDFEENARLTRQVVEMAHPAGVAVEAELGYVPKLGQAEADEAGLTTPEEARRFVEQTGVDMLAVAIGNAHGFYKRAPSLDLVRLAAIREAVETPLVLHGSSGLTAAQWQSVIGLGMAKINFATEIKDAFVHAIKRTLEHTEEIDLRKTFPAGMEAVTRLVASKIAICQREDQNS
ncbi:MAG TPA: class II fructose-bisphosphate aldolase [Chthonomonadaceae bacterium]|nr:class II fructose-bisphosphate aldolase [Chthonomonadaceae bacterium]